MSQQIFVCGECGGTSFSVRYKLDGEQTVACLKCEATVPKATVDGWKAEEKRRRYERYKEAQR